MANVADLITYLQTLPQEASVEVLDGDTCYREWLDLELPKKDEIRTDTCWFTGFTLRLGEYDEY